MARKYKVTGCAKFFIFLLIAVPAAYFISAYYHGEDGVAFIKDKLGLDKTETVVEDQSSTQTAANNEEIYDLKKTVEDLKERIEGLEVDLKQKDQEIEHLKQQLEASKGEL